MKYNDDIPLPFGGEQLFTFLMRTDALKQVQRSNKISDGARQENSAEHSWQAALMVGLFEHWSNYPISVRKTTQMLLVHNITQIESENEFAASSIYGENPEAPFREMKALWEEFERGKSNEAKFARAIDAFLPLFMQVISDGKAWGEWRGDHKEYTQKKSIIQKGSDRLWEYSLELIEYCIARNWLY
ncbi:MAG: HD domain-containing protein [Caulobacterales bacterium]|nr:HD domain-containing protein [Caulobacterales bacterium]